MSELVDQRADVVSGFVAVDRAAEPRAYVERLNRTAAQPLWRQIKRRMHDILDLHPGDRLLDVGCGVGSDVFALASSVSPGGQAIGVDPSQTMLAESRRRAEGHRRPTLYIRGDAANLPFANACFDACRAERVLQHLVDPGRALAEMVRVTREDGRVVVVEPDYGTEVIQGASTEVTGRILECRRARYRQPTVGRALPSIFKALGLRHRTVSVIRLAIDTLSESERQMLRKHADRAVSAGAISAELGARWLAELEQAAACEQYQRAIAVFLVDGRR
jgi:ubiquinone/menaquinone biosynthesis C-methylase UbiE